MRSAFRLMAAAALGLAAIGGPVRAQDLLVKFDRVLNTVDVDAGRADIRDVVQQLFSQAGAPRVDIARDVRGYVSLKLRAVQRDSALAKALDQVDATYRVEGGVYLIRSNRSSRDNDRGRDGRGRGDDRWRGDDRGSGAAGDANLRLEDAPVAFRKHVDTVAHDRPIAEITTPLARYAGVKINFDRSLPGDIMLDVVAKDEPLWFVLQRMASAARLKLVVLTTNEVMFRPLPSFEAWYKGRRLGGSTGEFLTCRNCRFNELKRGWRYCPMCGERIER